MASGRMLNKSISLNKALAELTSDTSRLLFTWTIAHLDVEGRIHGDPVVLKSIVIPRLKHIDEQAVATCVAEWAEHNLVEWYEADGDQWITFPGFADNQKGLKKDRETASKIPAPEEGKPVQLHKKNNGESNSGVDQEELRSNSGVDQEELRSNSGVDQEELRSNSGVDQDKVLPKLKESKLIENNIMLTAQPEAAPSVSEAVGDDTQLYHTVKDAFLVGNGGEFSNYGKEGKAIKGILEKAARASPEDPVGYIERMMAKLWELKNSGDQFWMDQPYLPSTLNSSGLWDRIREKIRISEAEEDGAALIAELGLYR
jgi:hypothetical protein